MYNELPDSSPENVIAAPVGSKFTRTGEDFYLTVRNSRTKVNLPKKSFTLKYQNELWYSLLNEDTIKFETEGETWRKVSGSGKRGWVKISNKTTTVSAFQPVLIFGDIESVAAGAYFSYFLKTNGELWSAGENYDGALGLGFTSSEESASLSLTDVKKAFSGVYSWNTGFALKNDNTLWGTGYGGDGQFGNGTTDTYNVWTEITLDGDITGSGHVVDVACGEYFTAFLMSDNSLWAAGDDLSLPNYTPQLIATDVKSFAAGGYHLLYVKNDGTLFGVGENYDGQLGTGGDSYQDYNDPVQIDTNVKEVGAGGYHSGYIKNDDTLWVVGANWDNQLGTGDDDERNVPVQIDTNVRFVTGGDSHTLFIKNDNTLWGMGANWSGQLSITPDYENVLVPTLIDSDVSSVTAGYEHTLYIKTNKMLYGMGYNGGYELGFYTNSVIWYKTPTEEWTALSTQQSWETEISYYKEMAYGNGKFVIGGGSGQTKIIYSSDGKNWATASIYNVGQPISGIVYGGGKFVAISSVSDAYNDGRPEVFTSTDGITWETGSLTNANFKGLYGITYGGGNFVAVGDNRVVVSPDGINWTEGTSSFAGSVSSVAYGNGVYAGATEYGSVTVGSATPKPLFGGNTASFAYPGYTATGLIENGNLYVAGSNSYSQLGFFYTTSSAFNFMLLTSSVELVAYGEHHGVFLKNDGTLWGMGRNNLGQLGIGNYDFAITYPRQITASFSGSAIVQLEVGNHFSSVLTEDGKIWTWGYNNGTGVTYPGFDQKTNVPAQMAYQGYTASLIEAGGETLLSIDDAGNLYGIGNNYNYQITASGFGLNWGPVWMDSNVVSASVGYNHTLYIKNDGTLWGRGWNGSGQLGSAPNGNAPGVWWITGVYNQVQLDTNVIACSAGHEHTAYIKNDGTLWTMGRNNYGQLGNGNFTNSTSSIQVATDVAKVFCGPRTTIFVKNDGTVWGMGSDEYAELGLFFISNKGTYSTNALNWSSSFISNFIYQDIAFADNKFVIGAAGGPPRSLVSGDGINWTGSLSSIGQYYSDIAKIIYDGTKFLCLTSNRGLYTSTDGLSWTQDNHLGGGQWGSLAYGDGTYVSVAVSPIQVINTPKNITIG